MLPLPGEAPGPAARDQGMALSPAADRLLEITQDGVWDWHIESGEVLFSDRWCTMLGYTPDEVKPHVSSWQSGVHPDDWPVIEAALAPALRGEVPLYICEHRVRCKDGTYLWIMDRGKVIERAPDGRPLRMMGTHTDVTWRRTAEEARARAESLVGAQSQILEMIATNEPIQSVLHALLTLVEREAPEVLASVLIADEHRTVLRAGAAPSLPRDYCAAIDPLPIGESVGSCGTAAFRRERVSVEDIGDDDKWTTARDVALAHGLRACTSMPLLARDGSVLGTIAFYQRRPGPVAPDREGLLAFATHLAALALERTRDEAARSADARDQRFLADLSGDLQATVALRERGSRAMRLLAEFLGVPICGWSIVDTTAGTVSGQDEWVDGTSLYRGDLVMPLDARPTFSSANDLLVFRDSEDDPTFGRQFAPAFAAMGWRSSLAFGLYRAGEWVGVIYASDQVPRNWSPRELQMMRRSADRIWNALDVSRALEEVQRERTRLQSVLDALPVGVAIANTKGGLLFTNQRVADIWGGSPQVNATGDLEQYRGWWADSGLALQSNDWALSRALTNGETSSGELIRIQRFDGREALMLNAGAPIRSESGDIIGAVVVIEDVTEQVQLANANAQLSETSRRKSAFVSYLSHELRTPLNAIMGFSELLHDELLGPVSDLQREVLVDMLSSGRHLLRLLEDILDTARIEAGRLQLRKEPVALSELVDEVVGAIAATAEATGVSLSAQVDRDALALAFYADAGRVRQVLFNYLTNAIKFTARGGRVHLQVGRYESDWLRFSVSDTGAGISEEAQARLFRDFEQLEHDQANEGWGLGLALTRRLVEAHNGRVGVESTVGVGSHFWADFPV